MSSIFSKLSSYLPEAPPDLSVLLKNWFNLEHLPSTSTLLIATPIASLLFWYFFSGENAHKAAALRNVKPIKLENLFWIIVNKKRFELIKHEAIARDGKILGARMLGKYTILIAEPELVGQVLSKQFTSFPNRREFLIPDPAFAENLTFAPADKWKRLRSIVTPTFSAGKIRQMKKSIDETVKRLLDNLEGVGHGEVINAKRFFGAFTMDTIVQVAFGVQIDSLVDDQHPVILNARKMFSADVSLSNLLNITIIFLLPRLARLLNLRFNADVTAFFMNFSGRIIDQKRAEMAKGQVKKARSFIELMLEAEEEHKETGHDLEGGKKSSKFMTTEEITSMCVLFFLAGYDTTASALTLTAYNLALHPEVQEKLYEENETIFAKLSAEADAPPEDPFKLVTFDSLHQFEYLTACFNETLRLYPPGLFTEREAVEDVILKTEDGQTEVHVLKGDIIQIPTYSLHRDAEQFPNPEKFDPTRFLGEPAHHKYSFIPFGAGPRNCAAKSLAYMEAKLALLHFVRTYRVSPCAETKIPMEFYNQGNLLVPKDVLLRIEKR